MVQLVIRNSWYIIYMVHMVQLVHNMVHMVQLVSAQNVNLYEGILAIPVERIFEACGI